MSDKQYLSNIIISAAKFAIIPAAMITMTSCKSFSQKDVRSLSEPEKQSIQRPDPTEVPEKPKFIPPTPVAEGDILPVEREILVDGAIYYSRAFDLLTPSGLDVFHNAKEFISEQKEARFQSYAQRLQCTVNVTHVLNKSGYNFSGAAIYAVPSFLKSVESKGGKVIQLPKYEGTPESKQKIVDMINAEFSGNIPTGAVLAGCMSEDCEGEGFSAHLAIIGDKNASNDVMVYHNNWFRPNNLKGQRMQYMVSLENFYDLERPREWMATPWLNFKKDGNGKIVDIISRTPGIDDLDPLNGGYYIKIAMMPDMIKDIEDNKSVLHHKLVVTNNPHTAVFAHEKSRKICRSTIPFKDLDPRAAAGSAKKSDVYDEISQYKRGETFFDYNFEFVILDERANDGEWVKIKIYDANMYWGQSKDKNYKFGEIWIAKDQNYQCFEKGTDY